MNSDVSPLLSLLNGLIYLVLFCVTADGFLYCHCSDVRDEHASLRSQLWDYQEAGGSYSFRSSLSPGQPVCSATSSAPHSTDPRCPCMLYRYNRLCRAWSIRATYIVYSNYNLSSNVAIIYSVYETINYKCYYNLITRFYNLITLVINQVKYGAHCEWIN